MTQAHKLVRTNDPITSHLASESIDANRLEKVVLEVNQSMQVNVTSRASAPGNVDAVMSILESDQS